MNFRSRKPPLPVNAQGPAGGGSCRFAGKFPLVRDLLGTPGVRHAFADFVALPLALLLWAATPSPAQASCQWVLGDRICDDEGTTATADADFGFCPGCAGGTILFGTIALLYDVGFGVVALSDLESGDLPPWWHGFGLGVGLAATSLGVTHGVLNWERGGTLRWSMLLLGTATGLPAVLGGLWGLLHPDQAVPITESLVVCEGNRCRAGIPIGGLGIGDAGELQAAVGLVSGDLW